MNRITVNRLRFLARSLIEESTHWPRHSRPRDQLRALAAKLAREARNSDLPHESVQRYIEVATILIVERASERAFT